MNIIESLDEVLESLLLVAGDGLKITDLKDLLGLQKTEINAAVKRLKQKYGGKSGIHLIAYNDTIQFGSNPAYTSAVESVLNPIKERNLSNAVLETVAIVAYRQPVTRLEIEEIRGVNCDYAVQVLLSSKLIEVVGRKEAVGKPLLFGTTDEFLKRFRIESIDQLPDYEKLLENIQLLNQKEPEKTSVGLYNEFELPPEEVPEFLDGEKIEKVSADMAEQVAEEIANS